MKDVTENQILEIINTEFDLFTKKAFASMDKLFSELNNITIDEVQPCVGKAIVKGQLPNVSHGWATLASLYVTLNTMNKNIVK